jgi:hypothetical protein
VCAPAGIYNVCDDMPPRGFEGTHGFEVDSRLGRTVLRHALRMRTSGLASLTRLTIFRPLHDALIEDILDRAAVSTGNAIKKPARGSAYVRALRTAFKFVRRLRAIKRSVDSSLGRGLLS